MCCEGGRKGGRKETSRVQRKREKDDEGTETYKVKDVRTGQKPKMMSKLPYLGRADLDLTPGR